MSKHLEYQLTEQQYFESNMIYVQAAVNLTKKVVSPTNIKGQKTKRLDVGCGRGEILKELSISKYRCFGIDFDPECVRLCQTYGDVRCVEIDMLNKEFSKGYFDFVIISHVLEHTNEPRRVIEMLKYVSKRYILISVPNLCSMKAFWKSISGKVNFVNKGHLCGWDASHLKTFLELACGLKIVEWSSDKVFIPSKLFNLMNIASIGEKLQTEFLPKHFPLLCNSLIVLCEK